MSVTRVQHWQHVLGLGPPFEFCFEAMAVNQVVEKEIADLIHPNSTLGINVRLKKVLEALQDCGFLYTNMVAPASFLCHPQNRGGSMINGHNAHKKGSEIYQAG